MKRKKNVKKKEVKEVTARGENGVKKGGAGGGQQRIWIKTCCVKEINLAKKQMGIQHLSVLLFWPL